MIDGRWPFSLVVIFDLVLFNAVESTIPWGIVATGCFMLVMP